MPDSAERLARLEERVNNLNDNVDSIGGTVEKIANGVTQINLALATDNGFRKAINYAINGTMGIAGVVVGYLGFGGKHP